MPDERAEVAASSFVVIRWGSAGFTAQQARLRFIIALSLSAPASSTGV